MLTAQQQAIVNHLPATFTTAQAHDVAKENDMKSRTLERFLNDNIGVLFRKEKHGDIQRLTRDGIVGIVAFGGFNTQSDKTDRTAT